MNRRGNKPVNPTCTSPNKHFVKGDPVKAPLIMKNKEWGRKLEQNEGDTILPFLDEGPKWKTLDTEERAIATLWVALGIRDDANSPVVKNTTGG